MGVSSVSTRLLARQPDRRLLQLLAQGHERAFEAIVLRYSGELLSYCARLGLSEARAEDALQHSLLKAWLALQGGSEVRELRAWLYRVVHNTAVNVMRSSSDERALDLDAALIEAAGAPESELERVAAAREALAHVAALPQMQRHAMLLSALEGRTHEEVASALGITDVAVRGLLYRARVTLRAAAAAFTPAPLIGWCAQTASRLGARAGLPTLTLPPAAPEAGGTLLKGAALAATAALAAGAVLGPLHPHHLSAAGAHAQGVSRALAGSVAEAPRRLADGSVSPGPRTVALSTDTAVSKRAPAPSGVQAHHGWVLSAPRDSRQLTGTHSGSGRGNAVPAPAPAASAPTSAAGSAPVKAVTAEDAPEAPVRAGGGGEASGPAPTGGLGGEAPTPVGAEAPAGKAPPTEHEEELAREQAEQEREAAEERGQREAESAREQAEREAEAARAKREHESEAAHGD